MLVSWFGPIGAAAATTGMAWLGAAATMLAVSRIWWVLPRAATLVRSITVCGIAYTIAALRPLQNAPFCPITASGSNFNPRNIQYIPPVKIFAFLVLEQN
jgi:hypothetical protein